MILSVHAGRKGPKRKRCDSVAAKDEDFVPGVEEEEEEEEEEEIEGMEDEEDASNNKINSVFLLFFFLLQVSQSRKTPNGLTSNVMQTVWDSMDTVKQFREEHYSSWVFPEWVVSTEVWHLVPPSDLEKYLPQELQSAAFRVPVLFTRFTANPAHPDRWDMLLYAGGPVWAMEWCPTPDSVEASQYIALACHRGMEDEHCVNKTHSGVGLIQLWHLGTLKPDSQPALAYGLAQDQGFVWTLKWCPAGGWELPSCDRKAPFLPRLGLLAVATSNSVVTIYSLPHPDALHSKGVLTLKLGSLKAPRHEKSGRVLSMDWLPKKPHNIMAIGFYDGVVGLWDLTTKSSLLRLQDSGSLTLLPYRCLLAHDNAVLALAFCPASRFLLVTAGEDRYVKTWDLRRLYEPITVQKRYLTNEIYWPLNAPGVLLAQENAYAPYGSQGVHYFDHHLRAIFAVPRTSTVWVSVTSSLRLQATFQGHNVTMYRSSDFQRTFARSEKRAVWKRMRDTELKTKLNMDEMPLAALHKVRFNPNMCCHTWLASGGQSGLVRMNCLRAMIGPQSKKIMSGNRAQFKDHEDRNPNKSVSVHKNGRF
uniref:General transcription factor IIIC, polypeptide 2, beta n=1 Tax=Cyclopterus lumpus TaxID=8103 RepID=A0A8C2ZRX1_CYCLU